MTGAGKKRGEPSRAIKERRSWYLPARTELALAAVFMLTDMAATLYFAQLGGLSRPQLIAFAATELILLSAMGLMLFRLSRWTKRFSSALSVLDDACARLGVEPLKQPDDLAELLNTVLSITEEGAGQKGRNDFLRQQAELYALQSQINPHFLYNSLETIRGEMLSCGNTGVAEMTEALARFFRYNISKKGDLVRLREELSNLENYISIQQYRFGSRVGYSVVYHNDGAEALECLMPKLTLQPLVENAILHGIDPRLEGGAITVHIDATDRSLIITVSDDGVGMDEEALARLRERLRQSSAETSTGQDAGHAGIAVANINMRLKVLYGNEYGIVVSSTKNLGTDVELTMPLTPADTEARE